MALLRSVVSPRPLATRSERRADKAAGGTLPTFTLRSDNRPTIHACDGDK